MVCREEFGAFGGKEYLCRWKDSGKANGLMPVTILTAKIQKNKGKSKYFLHLIYYMEYTFQEMPDVHGKGERKVFPKATHCSQISNDFFVAGLSHRTSYGKGTIEGVVQELTEELDSYLTLGHSVKVDGLGTFNISLGMKEGHETEEVKEGDERYDTYGVYIKTINFIPDQRWLHRLRRSTELHKVGEVKKLHQRETTLEERRLWVLNYLEEHPYMRVRDYIYGTQTPRSTALRELHKFVADPDSGIKVSGFGSHKVFVKE